ncbi:MAG: DUF2905 domain-containing protein [Pseudomonadota bacterium]
MNKWLIVIGAALVAIGVLWPFLMKVGLGRLPGDILIRREGFTFYMPITTMVLISVIATLILRWLQK